MAYQLELMPSTISRKSFDIALCSMRDHVDCKEESQIDCPLLDKLVPWLIKHRCQPMAYQLELMPSMIFQMSYGIALCSRRDHVSCKEESLIDYLLRDRLDS